MKRTRTKGTRTKGTRTKGTRTKLFRKLKKPTKKRIRKRGGGPEEDARNLVKQIKKSPPENALKFINGNDIESYVNIPFNTEYSLHEASKRGLLDIVKALIEKGAEVDTVDSFGKTPLHYTIFYLSNKNELSKRELSNRIQIIELLISEGADVNMGRNSDGTPLIIAIKRDSEVIVKLLLEKGADINAMDGHDNIYTPLETAISFNRIPIAKLLLEKKAHITSYTIIFALKSISLQDEENKGFMKDLLEQTPDKEIKKAIIFVITKKPELFNKLMECLLKIKTREELKTMDLTDNKHTILHVLAAHGPKDNMETFINLTADPE